MTAYSNKSGHIFQLTGERDHLGFSPANTIYPHNYPGFNYGRGGVASGMFGSGVSAFVGGRSGEQNCLYGDNEAGNKTSKSFGFWEIQSGEKIDFQLHAAVSGPHHDKGGGWGQYEGICVSWFEMKVHSWPGDP